MRCTNKDKTNLSNLRSHHKGLVGNRIESDLLVLHSHIMRFS